ncbi:MAG TPA: helix-turn-helix transcriptional regulator [Thermoanaerobaculia bacterium]|nr:helix-turn-helix transcriptional regulator [Thermoanaerobaculia bacterium]
MKTTDMREFGVRLARFRNASGLSITQLAKQAGIDYMQVSRYEKGAHLPTLDNAIRIARVLRITLDQLATGVEPAEPAEPPVFRNTRLLDRMRELDRIPEERQEMALRILDTVITGYELEGLSDRLRRT